MDMGSLRAELQLPHHFITGEDDNDLDEDIMMLGSTPQVHLARLTVISCPASIGLTISHLVQTHCLIRMVLKYVVALVLIGNADQLKHEAFYSAPDLLDLYESYRVKQHTVYCCKAI